MKLPLNNVAVILYKWQYYCYGWFCIVFFMFRFCPVFYLVIKVLCIVLLINPVIRLIPV